LIVELTKVLKKAQKRDKSNFNYFYLQALTIFSKQNIKYDDMMEVSDIIRVLDAERDFERSKLLLQYQTYFRKKYGLY